MAPTAAPTPMPALAPELRLELEEVELLVDEGDAGNSVMAAPAVVVGIVYPPAE